MTRTVTVREAIAAANYLGDDATYRAAGSTNLSALPMTKLVRLVDAARRAGAEL